MSDFMRLPLWARILLIALAALAIGRGIALVQHTPLLAFANSYDQVRYTTCLDVAPWRPGVPADRANPPAPLSRFAFQPMPPNTCTWTSDLLFTAPVALGWRISEHLGARAIHSVRRLADLRLLVWLVVAFWATRAFLREKRPDIALAHLAWLAVVGMDPANTLYLSTFYAEAAAVFGLYVCGVGTVAALLRPTRVALAVAALGAVLLATSKFQHMLLPAILCVAVAIGAGRAGRNVALALLVGAALGGAIQYTNGARNTPMAHNIRMVNRADYVLSVLLRETSDPYRVVKALDIDEACASFTGKSVYAMPGPVNKTCKSVDSWRHSTMWWLLVSDPPGLARALGHIPALLLPWQPEHLGLVEGGNFARVPSAFPQLSNVLGRSVVTAWVLLLMPWLIVVICFVRRAPPPARAFALMCAAGSCSVPLVALLGDGDVEYAKHAHLTIDFVLASLCVPLAATGALLAHRPAAMKTASPQFASSRTMIVIIVVLACIATLRALFVWSHDPLYAYANSYDQTRYTTCFHFYPDRPDSIPPQQNSPDAPYAHYRFITTADPMCYWSSEFVFGATTALIWKGHEWLTGDAIHDARGVGVLRWLALLALSLAFSRAWLRKGDARAALANAALLPLVFADPGNVLYLNTFYAEWTALLAAYALLGLLLLYRDEPRTRTRFLLLAFAALALATSKIQHMLLPLAFAIVVLLLDRVRLRRITWRAFALACGAVAGLFVQFVQLQREGSMMDTIRQYNNADVVFTALLPLSDDPRALLEEMGLDPGCVMYSGMRAWQMPDLPNRACRGLVDFSRSKELGVLLRHPDIAARLARQGVFELDPWLAQNIGHVEGAQFGKIPASVPSVGTALHANRAFQWILLALPLFALFVLLMRPGISTGSAALEATALVVTLMIATLGVTLLGDGLADTAKQGHLIINAALAWIVAGIMMGLPVSRRTAPA